MVLSKMCSKEHYILRAIHWKNVFREQNIFEKMLYILFHPKIHLHIPIVKAWTSPVEKTNINPLFPKLT